MASTNQGPLQIDAKAARAFVHAPLPDAATWIRLLRITSAPDADVVAIAIESFELEHAPSYLGISYTWGDLDEDDMIANGRGLKARRNGVYALRQSQMHYPHDYIWNDAVCIDQSSDIERGHQVAMMHTIYNRAALILACIGPRQDDSEILLQSIDKISVSWQMIAAAGHEYWYCARTRTEHHLPVAYCYYTEEDKLRPEYCKQWFGVWMDEPHRLKALLQPWVDRPYWYRLWTLQERGAGKKKKGAYIDILCGTHRTPWERFSQFRAVDRILSIERINASMDRNVRDSLQTLVWTAATFDRDTEDTLPTRLDLAI